MLTTLGLRYPSGREPPVEGDHWHRDSPAVL